MTEPAEKSPYGPGFIAACITLTAILACGALLLLTNPSDTDPASSVVGAQPSQPTSSQRGGASSTAQPVAQPSSSTSTGSSGTSSSCGLADGDQAVPSNRPPKADLWEISRRVVVPRSSAYGPGKTDPDGFRRCFAHSPTGAVYAAYNVIAALADQSRILPTATKLMVPGRDTDLLLQEVRKETADTASAPAQVAGYRIVDAGRDRVTIMLAMPVKTEFMSGTFTLTWRNGDWKLVPPPDAAAVGTPYSQHHNLNDFVAWSGV
ncbi:hypothetical protein OHA70_12425 [Kribbella sp. NBC_00382]|uniref:hypothetical protein n=1 Tax=Kribbella sp. NBC_00382 TaxID=2975967 RepID=UPI002E226265